MIIGMNMTFGPMHILGLQGQPRRMYVWTEDRAGEGFFNLGVLEPGVVDRHVVLGIGIVPVLHQRLGDAARRRRRPLDPWDARSLEWITTSPPKEHNFDRIPTVHALDEFFHRKYEDVGEGDQHEYKQVMTGEEVVERGDRSTPMPTSTCRRRRTGRSCSRLACPIMAYGVIYSTLLIVVGVAPWPSLACSVGRSSRPTADDTDFDPPAPDGDQPSKEVAVSV